MLLKIQYACLSTFTITGTNKPFDAFHLKILNERLRFSVQSGKEHLPSLPNPTPPPWDCSGPVLPQSLLLQACTSLTASVRKATGNSSHPHSSCAIPPILLWWRRLALVTGAQELSHSEGRKERSLFVPHLAWGSLRGCLLSSFLYCFSFRSSFFFFFRAELRHPVFKTAGCFFGRWTHALTHILLKGKTILPGEESWQYSKQQLTYKSKRERLMYLPNL